ncbi:TIGR01621 family pseudouridine synthase [Celerinatantimonas sp. YJH-8]|uniref:TIGR01621 family pseudouridine synthase n=1 Tax=Celerinatantimonas sp. YJH-8 TaxID=3228714 RepID=UPI0038BFB041
MQLPIVFEHPDFLIVDKPAGLSFHRQDDLPGLAQLLKEQTGPVWPVHRLDKMTSGLVIFALNKSSAAHFLTLFQSHQINKYYLALAQGKPKKKQGLVLGDMEKSRGGNWILKRTRNNPAKTRFLSLSVDIGLRAYLLRPYSGKTHQLRVAMKSLGVPILGDSRYGGEKADRGYLDACALDFNWQGEHVQFTRLPHQGTLFQSCCSILEPWELPWQAGFPD